MMVMGRSISNGVPIAMLCYPAEHPGEKLKFKIVLGFCEENKTWDSEQEFSDFGSAVKSFMNYEHTGIRSFTAGVADRCAAHA